MTRVSEIQAQEQAQLQQKKSAMKADERIEVFEGMTIEDIEQNGSEAQKIVAAAFDDIEYVDNKGDGKFDKYEAANLNNYRFALDKNKKELRAHNLDTDGHVTIKYNNLEELKKYAGLVRQADDLSGDITFDLRSKTAKFENIQGNILSVGGGTFNTVTIRNANVSQIFAAYHEGTLKLEGVADCGLLWDSETLVTVGEKTRLSAGNDSKIQISRWDDEE